MASNTAEQHPETAPEVGGQFARRWRWLADDEGLTAIGDSSFEATMQSADIRPVDSLIANAQIPWSEALLDGAPGVPAVGRWTLLRSASGSAFERGSDGQILRDAQGRARRSESVFERRMRVASVLLDEQTRFVFALGFAMREMGMAQEWGRPMDEQIKRAETRDAELWDRMEGAFKGKTSDSLMCLSMAMGRLGERLRGPRGQEGDSQAMAALGALAAVMESDGFAALLAQTEAGELEKEAPRSGAASAKPRAPGRI